MSLVLTRWIDARVPGWQAPQICKNMACGQSALFDAMMKLANGKTRHVPMCRKCAVEHSIRYDLEMPEEAIKP